MNKISINLCIYTLLMLILLTPLLTMANSNKAPRRYKELKTSSSLRHLKVSDNKRFLVYEDGKPFFYLGDTAWELFHRLNREEAELYLKNRASKGYTVIQAVVLGELDGLTEPNAYGNKALINNDPTTPNEAYFQHVDWIVNKAQELGLYIGMLPSWGSYWRKIGKRDEPPMLFNPQTAAIYGEWLGNRYKDKPIIWVVGGDRHIETDEQRATVIAMAKAIRKVVGTKQLITFHPTGVRGSAEYFHNEDWLDFNMRQNGHGIIYNGIYDNTLKDYQRTPIKPVLDSEPIYEDHSVAFEPKTQGWSVAADVRRPLYWNLFSGAFGHTYGHHSIWQMWQPGRSRMAIMTWKEALDQPGAAQMQYGRWLMESRPYLTRIPDDSVIVEGKSKDAMPGAGTRRFVATRDEEGSYIMVYVPCGREFKVKTDKIKGTRIRAWWFNPRNGQASKIGEFNNTGEKEFVPPDKGELVDWVLVLDDASRNFKAPGKR
jgi:hypothetical protein